MKTKELTTEKTLDGITRPLLTWYDANARVLPWRETTDPYRIWVSEIMLQQTRVAAVLGYYRRFLEQFPTVEALASAPEELLMKCWEGLGYYSRARNLQKAAKILAERGEFPQTFEELRQLPGIGEYTAAAIASAAFGKREAAVDGNVLRVVARLTDDDRDVLEEKTKRAVRGQVLAVMPEDEEEIRVFNQALMELGATVCIPNGAPLCESCPLHRQCLGRQRGTAETLPIKKAKKARRKEEKTVFVLLREGRVALHKRPKSGLLAGLWEFPNVEGAQAEDMAAETVKRWGLVPVDWKKKLSAVHIFTHVEWHMTGYVLTVRGEEGDFLWADRAQLESCAIPSAFARYHEETLTWLEE